MSQKDNFHLSFYSKVINGVKYNSCQPSLSNGPQFVNLSIINSLGKSNCQSLIDDLTNCLTYQTNVDDGFFTDSIEDRSIDYNYPNVLIDGVLTMSMSDFKELLEEWLAFIS